MPLQSPQSQQRLAPWERLNGGWAAHFYLMMKRLTPALPNPLDVVETLDLNEIFARMRDNHVFE